MAGNIIPAIATTNAMTAGLCVLEAFKVLRDDMSKTKYTFLTQLPDRVTTAGPHGPPNPNCPVCSAAQMTLVVDPSRATLNDLVEDLLRMELGYGEEFSIQSEAGILYDPEEDQNLPKTFGELGLKEDTFITVIDEADDDTKVNLVLSISEKPLDKDAKPIQLPEKPKIGTKPKEAPPAETDGEHPVTNGHGHGKRKRDAADAEALDAEVAKKRGKVAAAPDDDIVVLDDADEGAIVLD